MAKPSAFRFDPIDALDQVAAAAPKTYAFTATTARDARAWQRRARKALAACIGFQDLERVDPKPRVIDQVDRGDYVRRKVVIRTSAFSDLPVYLLVPKRRSASRQRLPVVLAFHGHGYGVKDIVGLWEDGSERLAVDGYHRDFATELARQGFLVAAPEIACFGEKQHDYDGVRAKPTTCHNAATYASMLGKSIGGLRVWEAMRLVDYLQTLPEADASRLGAMGISGGGMHAFFSAALDERIGATVISGYFCDWRHSILAMHHCSCNFVPGLLNLGELSDLAGLIAPRPLLVENGTRDEIFPIEHVKRTVKRAIRAWDVLGAPGGIRTDYFEGRHRIHGEKAYPFLAEHLRK